MDESQTQWPRHPNTWIKLPGLSIIEIISRHGLKCPQCLRIGVVFAVIVLEIVLPPVAAYSLANPEEALEALSAVRMRTIGWENK